MPKMHQNRHQKAPKSRFCSLENQTRERPEEAKSNPGSPSRSKKCVRSASGISKKFLMGSYRQFRARNCAAGARKERTRSKHLSNQIATFEWISIPDSGLAPFIGLIDTTITNLLPVTKLGGSQISIGDNSYMQVQIDTFGTYGAFISLDTTLVLDSLDVEKIVCQPRIFSPGGSGSVFEFTETNIIYSLAKEENVKRDHFRSRLARPKLVSIFDPQGHPTRQPSDRKKAAPCSAFSPRGSLSAMRLRPCLGALKVALNT